MLPLAVLELVTEVEDEERMFKVDKDIASVDSSFAVVMFVGDVVNCGVSVLVIKIHLFLELISAVSAWQIFNTKVSSEVLCS